MPAILHFSNAAGLLLDQLAATVVRGDPFDAPRIATPTPAMRRMVQMGLSERWGAAAHIDFLMLEHALWDCLARLDAHRLTPERQPARLLDAQALQALIFAQLVNAPPAEASEYLGPNLNAMGLMREARALTWRKALQLAAKLAQFFREYEYSRVSEHGRQGLAELWLHGKPCFAQYLDGKASSTTRQRVAALEAWQGELYRRIFGLGGLRDRIGEATGQYLYTLPQYREMVFAQERPEQTLTAHQPRIVETQTIAPVLHLFGLAHISPFHRSLIRQLSDEDATRGRPTDFRIFALNPCAEYWEDAIDTRAQHKRVQQNLLRQEKFMSWRPLSVAEKKRMQLRQETLWQESLAELAADNALLARWGMVGRENIQLWCQITDYAFAGRFREPEGQTLLASLQRSVLQRRGPLEEIERLPQDDSLCLIAAPEMHREIEALQADMWRRMQQDPSLRPDDIAIALVDAEAYAPVIDMVLGARQSGEAGHIPYVRPEAAGLGSDPYLRGLQTLLRMASSPWDRRVLLALLENPRAQAAMGLSAEAAEALAGLIDALNLYTSEGIALGEGPDPHAFATGVDRLLLGRWMEETVNLEDTSFWGYLPRPCHELEDESLAQGLAWLKKVETACQPFADGSPRPMQRWAEDFMALADAALLADPESTGETRLRRNLLALASTWQWRDKAMSIAAGATGTTEEISCPKSLFLESLREALASADVAGPPWLSGGVQVASLESLRGLPFRVIYIPGLQEGDFPDESLQNSLDLRQFRRVIGDLEPASRNRYAVLMALMQATDAAILSHVDRDLERNQPKQPSSVWVDLLATLESDHLTEVDGKPGHFRITQVTLNANLNKPVNMPAKGMVHTLARRTDGALHSSATQPAEIVATSEDAAFTSLDMDALLYFLKNPAGQNLKWKTGLSRRIEYAPEPHEPYALSGWLLQRTGFDLLAALACTASSQPLVDSAKPLISTRLHRLLLNGDLPPGRFGELALVEAQASLTEWFNLLANQLAPFWGDAEARALTGWRFGSAWPQGPRLPRIDLAPRPFAGMALTGYMNFVFTRRDGGIGLLLPQRGTSKPQWMDLLPAFVFAVLAARDESAYGERLRSAPLEVFFIPPPQGDWGRKGLQPQRISMQADLAEQWLHAVWPYLRRKPGEPLPPPLHAWSDWLQWSDRSDANLSKQPWNQGSAMGEAFRRQVRQRLEMARFEIGSSLSPLEEITALLPPPPQDDALTWAQDVFGPFLASLEGDS